MINLMFKSVVSSVLLMEAVNKKYPGSTIDPAHYGGGFLIMHVNVVRWTTDTGDFFTDLYNQDLIGVWMLAS